MYYIKANCISTGHFIEAAYTEHQIYYFVPDVAPRLLMSLLYKGSDIALANPSVLNVRIKPQAQ